MLLQLLFPLYKSKILSQARQDPKWRDAMHIEIDALETTYTWSLTHLPHEKKLIGCKWYTKSNATLMVMLNSIEFAWWRNDIIKGKFLTLPKLLPMWLKWSLFAPSLPLLRLVSTFINLMSTMPPWLSV